MSGAREAMEEAIKAEMPKKLELVGCTWMGVFAISTGTPRCILIEAAPGVPAEIVRRFNAHDAHVEALKETKEALLLLKRRIHFIGWPTEQKFEDGTPDWKKEIEALEKAVKDAEAVLVQP